MNTWLFLPLVLCSPLAPRSGDLRLPSIVGDHMVIQRQTSAPLWGWAAPESEVAVEADWRERPLAARADASGRFRVDLQTGAAGGPHRIRLTAGGEERV